jgi:hypothetical protein
MALWRVTTTDKKNAYQRTEMLVPTNSPFAGGKTFYVNEWYRWATAVIRHDVAPEQLPNPYHNPLDLDDYTVDDYDLEDGVSCTFDYSDDWTLQEKAQIESIWNEGGYGAFDERDMISTDIQVQLYGNLEVEHIGDEEDEVPVSEPKKSWPF